MMLEAAKQCGLLISKTHMICREHKGVWLPSQLRQHQGQDLMLVAESVCLGGYHNKLVVLNMSGLHAAHGEANGQEAAH